MGVQSNAGVVPLAPADKYGRLTVAGAKSAVTESKMRRWASARNRFYHRTKNGLYDPFTYFHLIEGLMHTKPWQPFSSRSLADHLNRSRPEFLWDPVTVGRILNDIQESINESNPGEEHAALRVMKASSGSLYMVTDYPAARTLMYALLDDLAALGGKVADLESEGKYSPRLVSPLVSCPSVVVRLSD